MVAHKRHATIFFIIDYRTINDKLSLDKWKLLCDKWKLAHDKRKLLHNK